MTSTALVGEALMRQPGWRGFGRRLIANAFLNDDIFAVHFDRTLSQHFYCSPDHFTRTAHDETTSSGHTNLHAVRMGNSARPLRQMLQCIGDAATHIQKRKSRALRSAERNL